MNNMPFASINTSFQRVVQHIGYLWDPEPKNTDPMNSIWLLGEEYPSTVRPPPPQSPSPPAATPPPKRNDSSSSSDAEQQQLSEALATWSRAFLEDFESRIWMTYRCDFAPIPKSPQGAAGMSIMTNLRSHLPVHSQGFTSDQGWGCMIRSGQCVLANALIIALFGRDWRKGQNPEDEKRLLALFADDPNAPFSLHKFVKQGELRDIQAGQWFGPTPTAQCIKTLADAYPSTGLQVHMTFDGNVYEDTFRATAIVDHVFKPTLLLVVTRLGLDGVNPSYWEALKATVQMKQSVGIAGGRPNSAHYFVGVQGDYLFYLDPHIVRPKLPFRERPEEYTTEEVDTCHTMRLRRLHVKDMDPSVLFAFLIRDERDWHEWKHGVVEVQGRSVVTVGEKEPALAGKGDGSSRGAVDDVISDDEDDGGLQ